MMKTLIGDVRDSMKYKITD